MKLLQTIQGVPIYQDEESDQHPKRVHCIADLSVDVDGAKHSYRLDNKRPPALDDIRNSAGYPHGSWQNVLAVDPNDNSKPYVDPEGFCVSMTSYQRPGFSKIDRNRYVDPVTIPYSVMPGVIRKLCKGVALGCRGRITRTTDGLSIECVYADSSGYSIGEAGILAAQCFGAQWNANNGDERKIYLYEWFPDTTPTFPDPVTGRPFNLIPV